MSSSASELGRKRFAVSQAIEVILNHRDKELDELDDSPPNVSVMSKQASHRLVCRQTDKRMLSIYVVSPSYKPRKKFMELAISEAKRAGDRGDYPIGAVITRLVGGREVVVASAGNSVKTSGSSIKHVELETLKYVSSGYGRYLPDFVLYSTHEPCAMCAGACVWS